MPLLLLFLALFVFGESSEKVLALFDFPVSISVHDLGEILHQSKVSSHSISKTGKLAQLWDESHLVTSLPILVDKEWLIWVGDGFIVPGLVVVLIANLGTLLVESRRWRHSEIDSFDSVSLLVVLGDNGAAHHGSRDGFLPIASFLLTLVAKLRDIVESSVCSNNSKSHVDVQ